MLAAHSCNLNLAAAYAPCTGHKAKRKARYSRLVRFFCTGIGQELQKGVLRAVLVLALKSGVPAALVMDRTEWEFGGERYLLEVAKLGFAFVARIKSNRQMTLWKDGNIREGAVKLRAIRRWSAQRVRRSAEVVIAGEYTCHVVCLPNTDTKDKEPYIYLLTNLDEPKLAGDYYHIRWDIERCFKHLKTNGFDLESHGFKLEHQLEIMMGVLTLLYVLCVVSGKLKQEVEAIAKGKLALKNIPIESSTGSAPCLRPALSGCWSRVQRRLISSSVFSMNYVVLYQDFTSLINLL